LVVYGHSNEFSKIHLPRVVGIDILEYRIYDKMSLHLIFVEVLIGLVEFLLADHAISIAIQLLELPHEVYLLE
jgi:hypothetical protein